MYFGYRFIEQGGRHHIADELQDMAEVQEYIKTNQYLYPEAQVTDGRGELVAHCRDNIILYPLSWALEDIHHIYLSDRSIYDQEGFQQCLHVIGYPIKQAHIRSYEDALLKWQDLYAELHKEPVEAKRSWLNRLFRKNRRKETV